jgi:hypothetical protein
METHTVGQHQGHGFLQTITVLRLLHRRCHLGNGSTEMVIVKVLQEGRWICYCCRGHGETPFAVIGGLGMTALASCASQALSIPAFEKVRVLLFVVPL